MKIRINTEQSLQETEIVINCKKISPEIERLLSLLKTFAMKLEGKKNGQTFILDVSDILYIDTVDKKTFFYTVTEFYETSLKLYELEERLCKADFFRANKSCILNFQKIKALKADLAGRILVTMINGERLYVSRQYASILKRKLGWKS